MQLLIYICAGIINTSSKRFVYENLEEVALTVQYELKDSTVPYCAFNGGNDVWVDIGNKALGISALQKYVFQLLPPEKQLNQTVCFYYFLHLMFHDMMYINRNFVDMNACMLVIVSLEQVSQKS